jgi:hypothetical protein
MTSAPAQGKKGRVFILCMYIPPDIIIAAKFEISSINFMKYCNLQITK